MDLKGKVALVTGASTGIGRAIAEAIASQGASVALVGRDNDRLTETRNIIAKSRGAAEVFNVDLRETDKISELVSNVSKLLGEPSIVANVAGVWHNQEKVYYGPRLDEVSIEQIDEVMNINLRATMLVTRAFLPSMIRAKQGKIINISGTFSRGGAYWVHYYVSKLAIENLTSSLADELREFDIQINCISPSDVATDALAKFFPEDTTTALSPNDVARLALFLISDESRHITGQTIVIKSQTDHSV